jgi:hypothetical protein
MRRAYIKQVRNLRGVVRKPRNPLVKVGCNAVKRLGGY